MEFKDSQTCINLMRAFAGESQARNRYTFAAQVAVKNKQHMIADIFLFTAAQEKEHANIFYEYLKGCEGTNIDIEGGYPVDTYNDILSLLKSAAHNEHEEYSDVYKHFSEVAKEEGFDHIAFDFKNIANIEESHAQRFQRYAELVENDRLYVSSVSTKWMCLNCGYIYEGESVPERCPVCDHDQGYFIRFEFAPYEK